MSVAKRDLAPGERLDGEGGYWVWGRLEPFDPARTDELLPLGLADGARVLTGVRKGEPITRSGVEVADSGLQALRAEAEQLATVERP
ncbi:MAG: SAF domain-containing protein [Thermoleophilia bacterium]|nr:SAF domain-containing protein [Thermoleophilia bacterium]